MCAPFCSFFPSLFRFLEVELSPPVGGEGPSAPREQLADPASLRHRNVEKRKRKKIPNNRMGLCLRCVCVGRRAGPLYSFLCFGDQLHCCMLRVGEWVFVGVAAPRVGAKRPARFGGRQCQIGSESKGKGNSSNLKFTRFFMGASNARQSRGLGKVAQNRDRSEGDLMRSDGRGGEVGQRGNSGVFSRLNIRVCAVPGVDRFTEAKGRDVHARKYEEAESGRGRAETKVPEMSSVVCFRGREARGENSLNERRFKSCEEEGVRRVKVEQQQERISRKSGARETNKQKSRREGG